MEREKRVKTKVIVIASGKGGVGKTSIALNLAKVLSKYKKKALLIDLDLYVRGLTHFVAWGREGRVIGEEDLTDFFQKFPGVTKSGKLAGSEINRYVDTFLRYSLVNIDIGLFLLPAASSVDKTVPLEPEISPWPLAYLLRAVVQHHEFDYVIIDTRAGADRGTVIPVLFSDISIIVSEEDAISQLSSHVFVLHVGRFQERYKDLLQDFQREQWMPDIKMIFNKVTRKEAITPMFIRKMQDALRRPALKYIPYDKKAKDAYLDGKFVVERYPASTFSLFLTILAGEIDKEIAGIATRRARFRFFFRKTASIAAGIYVLVTAFYYVLYKLYLPSLEKGIVLGILGSILGGGIIYLSRSFFRLYK